MWVPYVTGTPKMSQIGSLLYGITQISMCLILEMFHLKVYANLPLLCKIVDHEELC